jgi:hypothetical protein
VADYLIRLWTHDAEDGLVPEITVVADTRLEAAAMALQHFVSIGRPISLDSYLECEPQDGEGLRAAEVLRWLNASGGDLFYFHGEVDRDVAACGEPDAAY